ncbi:hypothetical protein NFI96_019354, partial [Prochilodus magdalenae]
FRNTFSFTPMIQYEGISQMTFSNGSVIATSTVLFGATQINQFLLKNIFVNTYQVHPSPVLDLNISYTSASSSHQAASQSSSSTNTGSATDQGVPGWGVALLVLAAIILLLLLLLFILLLVCWCCWWRRRGFMNVSDPDPPGYYNPDIPLYSTHSTFESQNGKSPQDSDSETSPRNRTGMYIVNN